MAMAVKNERVENNYSGYKKYSLNRHGGVTEKSRLIIQITNLHKKLNFVGEYVS